MVSLIRYAHRRWLSARQANAAQAVPAVHAAPAQAAAAEEEARLCANAQTKRKSNYHAARQCATAIYCLAAEVVAMALPPTSTADVAQTDTLATNSAGAASTDAACAAATDAFGAAFRRELERTRAAAARAPSDASVLYTRRAALEAAMAALPRLGLAQLSAALLDDELHWALTQIRRAPWHEVLWQHRRWLLCWRAQRRAVTHQLVVTWIAAAPDAPSAATVSSTVSSVSSTVSSVSSVVPLARAPTFVPADGSDDAEEQLAPSSACWDPATNVPLRDATAEQRAAAERCALLHSQWCQLPRKPPPARGYHFDWPDNLARES